MHVGELVVKLDTAHAARPEPNSMMMKSRTAHKDNAVSVVPITWDVYLVPHMRNLEVPLFDQVTIR